MLPSTGQGDVGWLAAGQRHPPQPPDAAVEVAHEQMFPDDGDRVDGPVAAGH
jgi:hypothetical protein